MKKETNSTYKYHLFNIFAMCLFCIFIYSNTLKSPFVFDDVPNITRNPHTRITKLDFHQLYDAGFKSPLANRPVANISFALNYYSGKFNVKGYHSINITIHLISGILVYFLLLILFKQAAHLPDQNIPQFPDASIPLVSLFSALIFITHPIQVHSVTYIVQRMNSLAVMFYLLSLLLYIHGRLTRMPWKRRALFAGCFIAGILALGSKEIAGTLPVIILLYEWYFFRDLKTDWLGAYKKYIFGFLIVMGLVAIFYLGENPLNRILSSYANRDFTMTERVLTQFRVIVFYFGLLIFPHPSRLNLLHHFTTSHALFEPITTLLSLLCLLAIIGLSICLAKRQRLISFCILWFFFNLAIESSIIGLEMIFEHRLNLPMFGFACLATTLLFHFFSKKRIWRIGISFALILSLGAATYARNSVFRDKITFWSDVVSKNPHSHRAHLNLGVALKKQRQLKEAVEHFHAALRIKPDYDMAHNNLGNALKRQGKLKEAIPHYLEAIRIKPKYAKAHYNLGTVYAQSGKLEKAVKHFLKAVRIKPNYVMAHNNLGSVLGRQGKLEEAVKHLSEAIRIRPNYGMAHNNLGSILARQGRLKEAIEHFSKATRSKSNYAKAHYNLGIALMHQGRLDEAIKQFSEVIRINPGYAQAHKHLGYCLGLLGKTTGATDRSAGADGWK